MRKCAMSGAGDADNRPGASDFPLKLFGRQVLDGQPLHLGEEMVVEIAKTVFHVSPEAHGGAETLVTAPPVPFMMGRDETIMEAA